MNIKTREYVRWFDDDCRLRYSHKSYRGRILKFVVQLEVLAKNRWYPVIRYDTAHDFIHRDYLHPNGRVDKTPVFIDDYNKALTFAQEDLRNNWEIYKRRFLEEVR